MLSNSNASSKAKALMEYFASIYGKKILSAQHTKTIEQIELKDIQMWTEKQPAICGFELLGYSSNVNYLDITQEGIQEIMENRNTIDTAIDWAKKGGIVTYTWHWYSPLGGRDKSFYTKHTDFDLAKAMEGKCPEYTAILRDLDLVADYLKRFRDLDIPILWRPFHEMDGGWFWWGASTPEACVKLWRLMYNRYVNVHGLNNLIWVWNCGYDGSKEVQDVDHAWYPGDEYVDIISRDIYYPSREIWKKQFDETVAVTKAYKMVSLAECGKFPFATEALKGNAPWLWAMTWCWGDVHHPESFVPDSEFDTSDSSERLEAIRREVPAMQKDFYADENVVTLDILPWNC